MKYRIFFLALYIVLTCHNPIFARETLYSKIGTDDIYKGIYDPQQIRVQAIEKSMKRSEIERMHQKSIQGKIYADRQNSVYDPDMSNEFIEAYLNKLKDAVKKNDIDKIADLISYPCRLNRYIKNINDEHSLINNKKEFKKLYKHIFSKSLKKLILKTTIDDLFVSFNYGFMIGRGEIWFDPARGITVFN